MWGIFCMMIKVRRRCTVVGLGFENVSIVENSIVKVECI